MKQPDSTMWRTPAVEHLANALVQIDDQEQMLAFLRDVCSFNELATLAQRLEVARMVDAGVSYAEIARQLGASTATVTRESGATFGGVKNERGVSTVSPTAS